MIKLHKNKTQNKMTKLAIFLCATLVGHIFDSYSVGFATFFFLYIVYKLVKKIEKSIKKLIKE
ncbi:MAG: hypothetical protein WC059_03055 [Candidatus Paceibacterota bacterium]